MGGEVQAEISLLISMVDDLLRVASVVFRREPGVAVGSSDPQSIQGRLPRDNRPLASLAIVAIAIPALLIRQPLRPHRWNCPRTEGKDHDRDRLVARRPKHSRKCQFIQGGHHHQNRSSCRRRQHAGQEDRQDPSDEPGAGHRAQDQRQEPRKIGDDKDHHGSVDRGARKRAGSLGDAAILIATLGFRYAILSNASPSKPLLLVEILIIC